MMFLLAANRMSRGYASCVSTSLAVSHPGDCRPHFAISRPLAGGWLSQATGGRPDTTIILFDRSPACSNRDPEIISR